MVRTIRIRSVVACLVALSFSVTILPVPSAEAHGTGVVKSCQSGTDCTQDSSKNAVFAVCAPRASTSYECATPRQVTIQLSNFGGNNDVYVYFLNSEVDDPTASDCSQALGAGITELPGSPVTSGSDGKASLDASLPPGNTPGSWSYGTNWLCASTVPMGQSGGIIGDQQFAIYPV